MTELERCINYLRFGQAGDFVASDDGKTMVIRKDRFFNTLPNCYVKSNGEARTVSFKEAVEILKQMA